MTAGISDEFELNLTEGQHARLLADTRSQARGWKPSGAYLDALRKDALPGMAVRDKFYEMLDELADTVDSADARLLRIKHVLEHYHNGDFATTSRDFGKGMAFIVDLIEKAERGEDISGD